MSCFLSSISRVNNHTHSVAGINVDHGKLGAVAGGNHVFWSLRLAAIGTRKGNLRVHWVGILYFLLELYQLNKGGAGVMVTDIGRRLQRRQVATFCSAGTSGLLWTESFSFVVLGYATINSDSHTLRLSAYDRMPQSGSA